MRIDIGCELQVPVELGHHPDQPLDDGRGFGARQNAAALGGDAGTVEIGLHLRLHGFSLGAHKARMRRGHVAGSR